MKVKSVVFISELKFSEVRVFGDLRVSARHQGYPLDPHLELDSDLP